MTNIIKPTEADLAPLIADAIEKQTLTQWKPIFLATLDAFFKNNPLRYRSYGPWWWLVKKELIASGNFEFGEDVDAEWVEALDYGKAELNLLAAHGYADWRCFMQGAPHEPLHTLELEDGETIDYLLTDTDMEQLALGQQLEKGR
jgi:hypothetical protein